MPNLTHLIIIIILAVISGALMYICSYKMLQIYQLSSYRSREVFSWFKNDKFQYFIRYFSLAFFIFVPTALFVSCFGKYEYIQYLGFICFIGLSSLFCYVISRQIKVRIKFTARMIRLSILLFVVYTAICFFLLLLTFHIYLQYAFIGILPLFIPFVTGLCSMLMSPLEKLINRTYKKKAAKKLASMPKLIKIGITGSYGKTTSKNILTSFLSKKYKVCASPKSYNTPMGLTRVVNDNLKVEDEILIAEMGARYVGDIKELCGLIKPRIGILTAIGDMHLETFGTKENIIKTKYELIDSLSNDGLAIFCGDNTVLTELYDSCQKNKLISQSEKSRIRSQFSNIIIDENGTSFDLMLDGTIARIQTKLLGEHIPSLIALCGLTAYELGISLEEIVESASELEQVPHRLELIKNGNTIIIDDAYNSNPDGAKNALKLLDKFLETKIVVTPGMVELAEKSKELNYEFGAEIAKVANYAILVGRNASNIKEGILSVGIMNDKNIFIVHTLNEAMAELGKITSEKKAVLFENDLPDNY